MFSPAFLCTFHEALRGLRSRPGARKSSSPPSAAGSARLRRARRSAWATTGAVLPAARGRQLLTVDPVIYGRHFDDAVPPRAAGAKLLKRNLSDLAAMGGRPTVAVLAVTLDPRVNRRWLEQFYRGLAACARRHHVAIVGGDLAQADRVVAASLTLLGRPAGPRVVTRTGARSGRLGFTSQACSAAASAAGIITGSSPGWPRAPGSPGRPACAP